MKVLFYLEPWVELGFPNFRLGTIRNHLGAQIRGLISEGVETSLLIASDLAETAKKERLLPDGLRLFAAPRELFQHVFPDYLTASLHINRGLEPADMERYRSALEDVLKNYKPDVIIAYECSSQALRKVYDDVLVLDATLGMFSREPYPETFALDPLGILQRSSLRQISNLIMRGGSEDQNSTLISELRGIYLRETIEKHNPIPAVQVRKIYDKVVLLPLQVSRYFMFDGALDINGHSPSQFDYLLGVLREIPSDVGVCVTEHPFEQVINSRNRKWLQSQFPNLILIDELQQYPWKSQFILPHVDAVVTVSSSLGYQALFSQKHLTVLGDSHLRGLADSTSIAHAIDAEFQVTQNIDPTLEWMITNYFPLTEWHMNQGAWLKNRLEAAVNWFRSNAPVEEFFSPIASETEILEFYRNGVRDQKMLRGVRKHYSTNPPPQISCSGYLPIEIPKKKVVNQESLKKTIKDKKVISFDIFDTLLLRTYLNPKDALIHAATLGADYLTANGVSITPNELFCKRIDAARRLLRQGKEKGVEDTTLRAIYKNISLDLQLTKEQALTLRRLELDVEIGCLRRRQSICEFLRYVKSRKKKAILTSDMYLDRDFLESILRKNKVPEYDALYLSSEHGKTKKSSALYKGLLVSEKLNPKQIVHIGDNEVSDKKAAERIGIKGILVEPVASEIKGCLDRAFEHLTDHDRVCVSALYGSGLAAAYGKNAPCVERSGVFDSRLYNLGAIAIAPMVIGFAAQILKWCEQDKVEAIYFLARDGWYVKKAFDRLAGMQNLEIKSVYLRASRRGMSLPACKSVGDLHNIVDMAFSEIDLNYLLVNRFGLDHQDVGNLRGYKELGLDPESLVTSKSESDRKKIKSLIARNSEKFLGVCSGERELYRKYLDDEGVFAGSKKALVDIGHNGSLQAALINMGAGKLTGYYFSTFSRIKKLIEKGHEVRSFLLHAEENVASQHYYCKNIGMFEFAFIPPQASFMKIRDKNADGEWGFEHFQIEESRRMDASQKIERAIDDVIHSFGKTISPHVLSKWNVDSEVCCAVYANYVTNPTLEDAHMVKDVSFADPFGGSSARYLIDPEIVNTKNLSKRRGDLIRASWWREGARLLHEHYRPGTYSYGFLGWRKSYAPIVRWFVSRIGHTEHVKEFDTNPQVFFSSLDELRYRAIGRIFFP